MEPEIEKTGEMPVGGLLSEYLACSDTVPDKFNNIGLMDNPDQELEEPVPANLLNIDTGETKQSILPRVPDEEKSQEFIIDENQFAFVQDGYVEQNQNKFNRRRSKKGSNSIKISK